MKITAKWLHVGWSNMTNGNTYTILYEDSGGAFLIDDTGALFVAPILSSTSYWQIVSITSVQSVQLYP